MSNAPEILKRGLPGRFSGSWILARSNHVRLSGSERRSLFKLLASLDGLTWQEAAERLLKVKPDRQQKRGVQAALQAIRAELYPPEPVSEAESTAAAKGRRSVADAYAQRRAARDRESATVRKLAHERQYVGVTASRDEYLAQQGDREALQRWARAVARFDSKNQPVDAPALERFRKLLAEQNLDYRRGRIVERKVKETAEQVEQTLASLDATSGIEQQIKAAEAAAIQRNGMTGTPVG